MGRKHRVEIKKASELIEEKAWSEFSMLCCGQIDKYIAYAKDFGWLKTSNKDYDLRIPVHILSCFAGLSGVVDLTKIRNNICNCKGVNEKNKRYLSSVIQLLEWSKEIKNKDEKVKDSINHNYADLVYVNKEFSLNKMHREKIAENVSYIINSRKKGKIFNSLKEIKSEKQVYDDVDEIMMFRDMEELVHNFSVDICNNGSAYLLSDSKKWKQSLSYGFLRLEFQRLAKIQNFYDKKNIYTHEKAQKLISKLGLKEKIELKKNLLF